MMKVAGLRSLVLTFAFFGCAASAANAMTLNGFRAAHGRAALRSDATLESMAQAHAQDMASREKLDHAGFMQRRGPAGTRAENVAYGCEDSDCTIQQWVNSSGHRTNMLLKDIHSYGLASAVSRSGRRYWALELGQ